MSTEHTAAATETMNLPGAAPFWMSLLLIPLAYVGAAFGGWTVALLPVVTWFLFSGLDLAVGRNTENADPGVANSALRAHRAITLIWAPLQFVTLFSLIWYVPQAEHLSSLERAFLFFGVGVLTGTIGINYSHELMHQTPRIERLMADALLAMVLYSHFRSEHLLVHHRHVGTPADAVTARYNEGFHRFYPRVLKQSLISAFRAETAMLARKGLPWHHASNPFFKYWALQAAMLVLAFALGGWSGLALFLVQAGSAIWQLELVNYIEHYGLTRKYLGEGRYEHVQPRHSWNSDQRVSNWLLINLQRHSNHHVKPHRRYPVLQTYPADEAPQLPFGYPVMTPRVRAWRARHYPEINDWHAYNKALNPPPGQVEKKAPPAKAGLQ